MQSSDVEAIRKETAKHLGSDVDLSYITEELIEHYKKHAKPALTAEHGEGEKTTAKANWATYGNHVTFDPGPGGMAYWKQDPKGKPNYGCGQSESWHAGKDWASNIKNKGNCAGYPWFFIGNYNGD